MSYDFRSAMRELRYLGARMTRLANAKTAILTQNKALYVDDWPVSDMKKLEDLLVDMAATRERQSELLKIAAIDVRIALRKKMGAR